MRFLYSLLIISSLNLLSFGAEICRDNQFCRRRGLCIEGNICACKAGVFGTFCDFKNRDYNEEAIDSLRCEQFSQVTQIDCLNGGVCVAFGTKPFCICKNTEFTGELCQFNRSCESTCNVELVRDENDDLICPAGQIMLYESCQDNGFPFSQTAPTTQTSTFSTQNPSQFNTTNTREPDSNLVGIIVGINFVFVFIIIDLIASALIIAFLVLRRRKRRKARSQFNSQRFAAEQTLSLQINGSPPDYIPSETIQNHVIEANDYTTPREFPMLNRSNIPLLPDTFRVNNRNFSIRSNITDLYGEIEDYYNNSEKSSEIGYAVIVPSSTERQSIRCKPKVKSLPPPIAPKPKYSVDNYLEPGSDYPTLFDQMNRSGYKELKPENLKLFDRLGGGHFGEVWRGTLDTPIGEIPIAIKLMKHTSDSQEEIAFLQEAAIIGQFNHINVLKLIGVTTLSDPKLIITELMAIELRDYLLKLKQRPAPPTFQEIGSVFVGFCRDIASGMAYLSKKGFIHRDLAARNILLDAQNVCKIADFGMSRRLMDSDYYKLKENAIIPLKWSAPESIFYKKYHAKSDVWSYAMVLFEIWSLGVKPWPFDKLESVINKLNESILLPPPPGCPRDVYLIMVLCWHPQSDERPAFSDLVRMFDELSSERLEPPPGSGRDALLGEDLHYSENMYRDLQYSYRK